MLKCLCYPFTDYDGYIKAKSKIMIKIPLMDIMISVLD
jgi:hypothetical protein